MKKASIIIVLGLLYVILCLPVSAAGNPVSNGWYMVVSGNSSSRVLDVNNWSINNGGNLEIYQRNETTNQIFRFQYRNNGYYTIEALHSGKYLHVQNANFSTNVHQWEGYNHTNAQWALTYAGNGYYYLKNRTTGGCLDNSGGRTGLGNNVICYPYNGTSAQKWKLVRINNVPEFAPRLRQTNKLSGSNDRNTSKKVTLELQSNYPITKLEVSVYNSSGKNMNMSGTASPGLCNFKVNHEFKLSKLSSGSYYYLVKVWYRYGYGGAFGKYSFSIKDAVNRISVNSVSISSKGLNLLVDMERPVAKKYCKYENGKVVAIRNADLGDGGVTIGYGTYIKYSNSKTKKLPSSAVNKYRKYGVDITNFSQYVPVSVAMEILKDEIGSYEKNVVSWLKKNKYSSVKQCVYDAMVIQVYNGQYDVILKAIADESVSESKALDIAIGKYKTFSKWYLYGNGWTNRLRSEMRLAKRGIYLKDY